MLKKNGRAGVVLPDPTLFSGGMKTSLKKMLLEECNLHTIVRLPKSVFAPYTNISTNLLFFTKGEPTKEIWYYEHQIPEGQKAYSMTSPMRTEEFDRERAWWHDREENDHAWKVSIEDIKARNYDLDIKNPKAPKEISESPEELLNKYWEQGRQIKKISVKLQKLLRGTLTETKAYEGDIKYIVEHLEDFVRIPNAVKILSDEVLSLAVSGKIVPQKLNEPSVKALHESIQFSNKNRAEKRVGGRKKENLSIKVDSAPFEIPESWVWVRGSVLFDVVRGVTYGKSDADPEKQPGYIALLRSHNIQQAGLNTEDLVYVRKEKVSDEQIICNGDILIAMSSGSKNLVGKAAQAKEDLNVTYGAFCAVIRAYEPSISRYLGFFFSTPYYREATALGGKGMGINNLTVGALNNLVIPLPALPEQKRIVDQVEKVMTLINEIQDVIGNKAQKRGRPKSD